jgi:peptidoglycan/LPS O-acetylase OafA/YrhL
VNLFGMTPAFAHFLLQVTVVAFCGGVAFVKFQASRSPHLRSALLHLSLVLIAALLLAKVIADFSSPPQPGLKVLLTIALLLFGLQLFEALVAYGNALFARLQRAEKCAPPSSRIP